MLEYVRISKGLWDYKLYPKNNLDLQKIIENAGDKDYYYGIYTYEDKHYDHWMKNGSLAGITDVKTNKLVWDFDDKENPENARQEALDAYSRLIETGLSEDDIQIYFSGNKGFHLIITHNEMLDRDTFENIVFGLGSGLTTLDDSVKDQQRLIRMPFTKNDKSGLYNIPISFEELNGKTVDEIKKDAADVYVESWELYKKWQNRNVALPQKLKTIRLKKPEVKRDVEFSNELDIYRKPKWLTAPRFALQEGYFHSGQRNEAMMVLCSTYKGQGFDKDHALALLTTVAEKQALREGSEIFDLEQLERNVVNVIYSPNWKGGIYVDKQNKLLQSISEELGLEVDNNEDKTSELVGIKHMLNDFRSYCNNYKEKLIRTGIQALDDKILIQRGMLVGMLGAPGSGKTSFCKNYVRHVSEQGQFALFESFDMNDKMLTARLLQSECNQPIEYIMDVLDGKRYDKKLEDAFAKVEKSYGNVQFNYRVGSTVQTIENDIIACKNMYGDDFGLVVVDYLEKVRGPSASDPTLNSAHIASRLADLAKEYNVAIILLLQPRKAAGDPREELLTYQHIKGSSVIQQDARIILTMSRPGYDPKNSKNDKYATIAVVKNNLGEQTKLDFAWDGVAGTIRPLNTDEEAELSQLRKVLERQKYEKEKAKSW